MNAVRLLLIFILVWVAVNSCSPFEDPGTPYKAQVMTIDKVDPTGFQPSTFELGVKTRKSLNSLEKLEGKTMKVIEGGVLNIKIRGDNIYQPKSFAGGRVPFLQYTLKNKVITPRDFKTLAILSIFASWDQIYDKLENITGKSMETLLAERKAKKIKFFFQPALTLDSQDESGTVEGKAINKANAAYLRKSNDFLLMSSSVLEKVPLVMNSQVIAHEFGHLLFNHFFFKYSEKECDSDNGYSLNGFNEGFSDFFSYLITGSSDVLGASMPDLIKPEQRNFKQISYELKDFPKVEEWGPMQGREGGNEDDEKELEKEVDKDEPACSHSFYCIGSLFAKTLNLILQDVLTDFGKTEQNPFTKSLFASLPNARDDYLNFLKEVWPHDDVCKIEEKEDFSGFPNGEIMMSIFLAALVKNQSNKYQDIYCKRVKETFSSRGFNLNWANRVCKEQDNQNNNGNSNNQESQNNQN